MSTMINSKANCRPLRPARQSFFTRLANALELRRQRSALRDLDDKMLDDLGLTRSQVETEARRPVWDAPANWLK
ncbi:DUF1127 domain-containing protein [Thalassovita aquimarina]|nr:DUF1127 domain-containing protein [Thalassovita aquimarina]